MSTIENDKVAIVHYRGSFPEDGEEFDSSHGSDPLGYLVGHKNMIPGFEQEMMGAEVQWEPNQITVRGSGNLRGIDVDMNEMPDAAMTLAVAALFAEGTTAIRNIYNWRLKETERLQAVSSELKKLGATIEEGEDYIII